MPKVASDLKQNIFLRGKTNFLPFSQLLEKQDGHYSPVSLNLLLLITGSEHGTDIGAVIPTTRAR